MKVRASKKLQLYVSRRVRASCKYYLKKVLASKTKEVQVCASKKVQVCASKKVLASKKVQVYVVRQGRVSPRYPVMRCLLLASYTQCQLLDHHDYHHHHHHHLISTYLSLPQYLAVDMTALLQNTAGGKKPLFRSLLFASGQMLVPLV